MVPRPPKTKPKPNTKTKPSDHAANILSAARELLDALRPSTRNSYRPVLATILTETQKLQKLAEDNGKPSPTEETS